ncbi:MAG: DUF3987 domain-containing protein [Candidatus Brocadia sinica]|nr:DUF3987 domain-containing protein [Candidatus Brocadia sinica]
MNKEEVLRKVDFADFYRKYLPDLRPNGKKYSPKCLCPFHDDSDPSLSIDFEDGRFNCFSCGANGDIFDFYQRYKDVDFPTAVREIGGMAGMTTTVKQKVVAKFEYQDRDGKILYAKERVEPGRDGRNKEFRFKHFKNGKWVNGRGSDPVLYRLPDLIKSKHCFVVEEEKKVDLLAGWGLVATCLDSGANSPVRNEYIQILGRKESVVILPDNDVPGKQYAANIANDLHGKVKNLKIIELPGLKEKGDVVTWAKLPGNNKEKLLELVEDAPLCVFNECDVVEEMSIDCSEIVPVIEFPFNVFPLELQRFIKKVSLSINIQPEVVAITALVILSSSIGHSIRISPKNSFEVAPFLWGVIVMPTGAGKSPTFNTLIKPIRKMQSEAYQNYKQQMVEYKDTLKKTNHPGKTETPKEPVLNQYFVSDVTVESLSDLFEQQPRGILSYQDELSGFILGMNQYKTLKGNDRQHYLELFNCQSWKVDRRSRNTFIPNTGMSIIGGIPPQIIPDVFGNNNSFFDGFIQRFIFVCPENTSLRFSRVEVNNDDLSYWNDLIHWCYEIPLNIDTQTGFVIPKVLILKGNALDLWESFYNTYGELSTVLPHNISAFIPKLYLYSLKFAGILQMIEGFCQKHTPQVITKETTHCAIELTKYYFGQVIKVLKLYRDTNKKYSEYQTRIIRILFEMQHEVRNGKLELSKIVEGYRQGLPEYAQLTSKKMSNILNNELHLLTEKSTGNYSYLIWEKEKIENFFKEIR